MANHNKRAVRLLQQHRKAFPGEAPPGKTQIYLITEADANLQAIGRRGIQIDWEGLRLATTMTSYGRSQHFHEQRRRDKSLVHVVPIGHRRYCLLP